MESAGPEDEGAGAIVETAGATLGGGGEEFVVERFVVAIQKIAEMAADFVGAERWRRQGKNGKREVHTRQFSRIKGGSC